MVAGHIGELELDVAAWAASNKQFGLDERNRVATSAGCQLAKFARILGKFVTGHDESLGQWREPFRGFGFTKQNEFWLPDPPLHPSRRSKQPYWENGFAPLDVPIFAGNPRMTTVSASPAGKSEPPLAWQSEGLVFNAFGANLRRRYGGRVQRVSIDAGFTCPNVDGAVARGGCNFCDNRSFSPSRRVRLKRVSDQLASGIQTVRHRYDKVHGFIAYFQPATNTYAPVDQLEEVYRLALQSSPEIVGLAVGTRPDCVPDSVLDLLESIALDHDVSVEFGMQTVHAPGLTWMNRAHTHEDQINAIDRARGRGFECCAHVILGIPGETHDQMMQTADEVARLGFDAVKIHNLYVVQGTPLAEELAQGQIQLLDRISYIRAVVDFLQRISPHVIVERVSGEAPAGFLIEPEWCAQKSALRLDIEAEFRRRGTRQGEDYVAPELDPTLRSRPDDQTPEAIRDMIDRRGRLPVLKMHASE